jgi:hypothetical protein
MAQVTKEYLTSRARQLLVGMTERDRWVYALPEDGFATARTLLGDRGLEKTGEEARGDVLRFMGPEVPRIVLFEHDALGVVFVEGEGSAVVPHLRALLDATGFLPQSGLWGAALDIGTPGSGRALTVLAHMAVFWDEDWIDMFVLHLASPDAVVRRQALAAVTVAAMVSRDAGPARTLVAEALTRERFPQLAATMRETLALLEVVDGGVLDLAHLGVELPSIP